MRGYLTAHQNEAYEKFKKLKVGALFMEMGTGKTVTTLELIDFNKGNIDCVLWFTPFSTKCNLRDEIAKWQITDVPINIIGWETLSQSDKTYLELLDKVKGLRLFIVADESTAIKNGDTKRYQRLQEVAKFSDYRLLLNGTPITKSEWDLYYQMNFLSPKILGMNESEFLHTFFTEVKYKKKKKQEKTFYKLSDVNIDYLDRLIEPYIINTKFKFDKEETTRTKLVTPTEETFQEYNEVKKNQLNNLFELNSETIILLLQKLNLVSAKDCNKAREVAMFIEDRQVICFVQFKDELDRIKKKLNGDCFEITGDTNLKDRTKTLADFEKSNKPLLMTFGVGAYGLNLQFCNEMVFSSMSFDYSKLLQAKGRIRRIGQKEDIKYTFFDLNLPINNFISKNINKKQVLSELLIKHLKENYENL